MGMPNKHRSAHPIAPLSSFRILASMFLIIPLTDFPLTVRGSGDTAVRTLQCAIDELTTPLGHPPPDLRTRRRQQNLLGHRPQRTYDRPTGRPFDGGQVVP